MKSISILAVMLFGLFNSNAINAQSVKEETIKVWGNCGMCKSTIEKAAKKAGAKQANWDEETKELKVSYAVNKTSNQKIQQEIANNGYDTEAFTAPENVYNKLHGCCKYDRKNAEAADTKTACCNMEKCNMSAEECKAKTNCKDADCCKM